MQEKNTQETSRKKADLKKESESSSEFDHKLSQVSSPKQAVKKAPVEKVNSGKESETETGTEIESTSSQEQKHNAQLKAVRNPKRMQGSNGSPLSDDRELSVQTLKHSSTENGNPLFTLVNPMEQNPLNETKVTPQVPQDFEGRVNSQNSLLNKSGMRPLIQNSDVLKNEFNTFEEEKVVDSDEKSIKGESGAVLAGLKALGGSSKEEYLSQPAQKNFEVKSQDLRDLRSNTVINHEKVMNGVVAPQLAGLQPIVHQTDFESENMNPLDEVELIDGTTLGTQGLDHGVQNDRSSLKQTLSGTEFLNTLSSVRENSQSKTLDNSGEMNFSNQKFSNSQEIEKNGLGKKDELINDFSPLSGLRHLQSNVHQNQPIVSEMTANVVPGPMAKNQLTTDSLVGISGEIKNLSSQGGGEIRIRLKPEELGELNIRVMTDGSRVSLQIQASDEKAKKIIEGSLTTLKDNLSSHHLILSQIDLSVNQLTGSNQKDLNKDQQSPGNFSNYQENLNQNLNQGGNQSQNRQWMRAEFDQSASLTTGKRSSANQVPFSNSSVSQNNHALRNSRLDVRA